MPEWVSPAAIVALALAFLGAFAKFLRWTGKVDAEILNLSRITTEIREDIKKLFARLPAPPVARGSPLPLTDFGKEIAQWLEAEAWAGELARSLVSEVHGKQPFEVDAFCQRYVRGRLPDDWKQNVAKCAYEFGISEDGVRSVLRVVLRDALLSVPR